MLRNLHRALGPACLLLILMTPAAAASERYVALGDSYSSGTGTHDDSLDSGCQRSRYAYPALVAAQRPSLKLAFAACAGATTGDVLATQVSRLDEATRWVTITIGGNDVGFVDVIGTCTQSSQGRCMSAVGRARGRIRDDLPARLDAVYRAIKQRAPNATVIALGYPRLFAHRNCDPSTAFSAASLAALDRASDELRTTVRRRVTAAGRRFRFADAIPAFEGHEVCSGHAWLNGLTTPLGESYHPNRTGQRRGYTRLVLRAMS